MSVESLVQEAKSNMDKLIPEPPMSLPTPNIINLTIPEPNIRIAYERLEWSPLDSIASTCMIIGLMLLGYLVRIIIG